MNLWLQFAGVILFVIACIASVIALVGEDVDVAQHEVLLDELWDDEAVAG